MMQDIFDREGNIIGSVETVRMETKYGDGRGHVVEVVVTDDLSMSDFKGMDLRNADFHGMDLSQANFYQANLEGADFRGAHLRYTNFYDANLKDANFRGADMLCALFDRWKKEEMIYDHTTKFPPPPTYKPSFL